jgi:3,4-dihydroxy 2-butanone 4-phosphate synthase/GTP cyclohydrolase II
MSADVVQFSPEKIKFDSIDAAIASVRAGGFAVIADDEGRDNDGYVVCAAAGVSPDMINFMIKEARGQIGVAMTRDRAQDLDMLNGDAGYVVPVDAGPEFGVTTGLSAMDRATTIQRMASSAAAPADFVRPGHIMPQNARDGGVLRHVGMAEAASDIARLGGFLPMAVTCPVLNDEGAIARRDDLAAFAKKHSIPFVSVAQIIAYRLERERFVLRKLAVDLPTRWGDFTAVGYKDVISGVEHLALVKGDMDALAAGTPLVRLHHENSIVDMLGENDAANVQQMEAAMNAVNADGTGVVVYLRGGKEGAGGLLSSLRAYSRKMTEPPQHVARSARKDLRDYGIGAQILADLGITRFRLMAHNPRKIVALSGFGLEIAETVNFPTGKFDFSVRTESKTEKQPVKQENNPSATKAPESFDAPKTELKAEPRTMTMRMGAQIISGQALFEG